MAVRELAAVGMDSADKILLGSVYGPPSWLLSGYKEIAQRDDTMSTTEVQRLGGDTVTRPCQIREQMEQMLVDDWDRAQPYAYERNVRSL